MSERYPKYYKGVAHLSEIDVYAIHHLFAIQDPSGAIQHASKKLLLSGQRTGNKTMLQDIKEARDTLTRWIALQEQMAPTIKETSNAPSEIQQYLVPADLDCSVPGNGYV